MLRDIDLSKSTDKEEFKSEAEGLRLRLGELQRAVKEKGIPVIIVFEGWDAAGKGTLINELMLPMDPRQFNVYTSYASNEEERLRPFLWRYWTKTPAKGRIAIFDRSWYRSLLVERIDHKLKHEELERRSKEINCFEEQLTDDGNIIVKLFLHISKEEQKKRFKKLESQPIMAWKVTEEDWKHHKQYDEYLEAAEEMLERTDTDYGAWTIIEANDKRFAVLKMLNTVIKAMERGLESASGEESNRCHTEIEGTYIPRENFSSSIIDKINLEKYMEKDEYKLKLKEYQERLRDLEHELYVKRIPAVIVYEGWDAAGKGGSIKRLTENMDPRGYEVVPTAAPNDIEKAHHYLWRFWNNIPKAGHITLFDRSWYGRVLVERVEGFCSEHEWRRAYREINEMEEHITNSGGVLIKFWLHIDKDEQARRFEERQNDPYKRWKITQEDWRNRDKWEEYRLAADEMLLRTSTTYAPWHIIEANSKYYARIKAMKTVIDILEKKL